MIRSQTEESGRISLPRSGSVLPGAVDNDADVVAIAMARDERPRRIKAVAAGAWAVHHSRGKAMRRCTSAWSSSRRRSGPSE